MAVASAVRARRRQAAGNHQKHPPIDKPHGLRTVHMAHQEEEEEGGPSERQFCLWGPQLEMLLLPEPAQMRAA